ncbi:ATP-binding protein [Mumia quercus]|uniref:ATP-binding protein n=1 Tax=Mumia quercus TaxID=2976125 RepID=UPI0021D2D22C|nr:BTAD domain-containing putative transcriptional regulator [Mumia quercus]
MGDLGDARLPTLLGPRSMPHHDPGPGLSRRATVVLAVLALADHRVPRARLAALLWPGSAPSTGRGNLRVVVNEIRQHAPGLLLTDRESLAIDADQRERLDVVRFQRLARRALALHTVTDVSARGALHEAADAYTGDLLADLAPPSAPSADWVEREQDRLRAAAVRVLIASVDADLEAGPDASTRRRAEHLTALAPLSEPAHGCLLRTLAALGDPETALAMHAAWVRRSEAELGIAPSPQTRAVVEQIARGRGVGAVPEVRRLLPPRRSLVGRERDLTAIESLLADGHRLVTLVGPAGVGKSALANEMAHRRREELGEPVAVVDGEDVDDLGGLVAAVATAVGAAPDSLTSEALADQLHERSLLLVLDGIDDLVEHGPAIAALVDACPYLVVLATIQTPLGQDAEAVHPVVPLAIPAETTDAAALARSPAVRLFLVRAERAGVRLARDRSTLATVRSLCQHVDGLPLGVELAAARAAVLGVDGVLAALESGDGDQVMDLLGPGRTAARSRGLYAALAAATRRLPDRTQTVFRRLATLRGAVDLETVRTVCGDGDSVLDDVADLVDRRLVLRVVGVGGTVRFRQLETTRAFASKLLDDSGERPVIEERAAVTALARLAATWPPSQLGQEGADPQTIETLPVVRRFRADLPAVRAALAWCHHHGRAGQAAHALASGGSVWWVAGATSEGLREVDRVVASAADLSDVQEAQCRLVRAALLVELGGDENLARARHDVDAAVDVVLRDSDPEMRTALLVGAVRVDCATGARARAEELARVIEDAEGDPRWRIAARFILAHPQGHPDPSIAVQSLADVLADARAYRYQRMELMCSFVLRMLGPAADGIDEPLPDLDEMLAMASANGDEQAEMWLLAGLGLRAARR